MFNLNFRVMCVYFRLLIVIVIFPFFLACQTEDIQTSEEETEAADIPLPEEYFKVTVKGEEILITDENVKSSDRRTLGAEIYTWYDLNENKFHALRFWAKREGRLKDLETLGGYIQKFNGIGVYDTGTNRNKNYCHYYEYGVSWYSDVNRGEKGSIEITAYSQDHIEGSVNYRAYNANDPAESMEIYGEFRMFIED